MKRFSDKAPLTHRWLASILVLPFVCTTMPTLAFALRAGLEGTVQEEVAARLGAPGVSVSSSGLEEAREYARSIVDRDERGIERAAQWVLEGLSREVATHRFEAILGQTPLRQRIVLESPEWRGFREFLRSLMHRLGDAYVQGELRNDSEFVTIPWHFVTQVLLVAYDQEVIFDVEGGGEVLDEEAQAARLDYEQRGLFMLGSEALINWVALAAYLEDLPFSSESMIPGDAERLMREAKALVRDHDDILPGWGDPEIDEIYAELLLSPGQPAPKNPREARLHRIQYFVEFMDSVSAILNRWRSWPAIPQETQRIIAQQLRDMEVECSPFELDLRIRENGVQTNGGDDGATAYVEAGREARGGVGDAPGPGGGGGHLPPAWGGHGPGVPVAGRLH